MTLIHRTKIIGTLGPATEQPGVLEKLLEAGMDVVRINAAHGNEAIHGARLAKAREAAQRMGVPLAALLDLPGPKHRLGVLREPSLRMRAGDEISLGGSSEGALPLEEPHLVKDLRPKEPIYLADGSVRLIVLRVSGSQALCRVDIGGIVRSHSGLNLPESQLSLRLPTLEDRRWIQFGCEQRIDWFGISFVRNAEDVVRVRKALTPMSDPPLLMAKIEKRDALTNLGAVIAAADGVMVARGDLGVETPLEQVPLAQKRIIAEATRQGKPVVTATQMLESMVENPSPTRAEVTDIANAILDGTDAIMLSAETAIGKNGPRAVKTMTAIIGATEAQYPHAKMLERLSKTSWGSTADALSLSIARLSFDLGKHSVIVVSAEAATSAYRIARFRPSAPIYVLSPNPRHAQRFNLVWNVRPLVMTNASDPVAVRRKLKSLGEIKAGSPIIFISTNPRQSADTTDTLRILRL